jgi:hypothetical protein
MGIFTTAPSQRDIYILIETRRGAIEKPAGEPAGLFLRLINADFAPIDLRLKDVAPPIG